MALAHTPTHVPNHHAHHGGFSGLTGLLLGLLFTVRRGGERRLAGQHERQSIERDVLGLEPAR
ncbi:MAG TPA: hypothetical protein VJ804_04580, partial [Acidimicrobiales bacterium]|nr:hypothetical protein [Acidimicrobiales bacterium]